MGASMATQIEDAESQGRSALITLTMLHRRPGGNPVNHARPDYGRINLSTESGNVEASGQAHSRLDLRHLLTGDPVGFAASIVESGCDEIL